MKKELLIVKKGLKYLTFKTASIAFIYTENDITYIVNGEGRKFFCGQKLNKIEPELGPNFFRANRQYLINIYYIKSFRPVEKTKIVVEMNVQHPNNLVPISQVTARKFRDWIASF